MNNMHPYQFSKFELELMIRLQKVFLKFELFDFDRWPMIYWGDHRADNDLASNIEYERRDEYDPKYQDDYMGVYRFQIHNEGFIELYKDRIAECAESIAIKLNLDYNLTFELLRAKVLLHELGHWLTHWCIKEKRKERQGAFYQLAQDKFITETMAQISVVWACKGLSNNKIKRLLFIMDTLTELQPPPYSQYKKLGKKTSKAATLQKRYLHLLDVYNLDIDYLLLISSKPSFYRSIYSKKRDKNT